MENQEKEKEIVTSGGEIDKDVLEVIKDKDIMATISDDKQCKRLVLNCFCEFLSEIKNLNREMNEFMEMISICSADKMASFFKEVNKNVEIEQGKIALKDKISQSHKKKTKKVTKNDKNAKKA